MIVVSDELHLTLPEELKKENEHLNLKYLDLVSMRLDPDSGFHWIYLRT